MSSYIPLTVEVLGKSHPIEALDTLTIHELIGEIKLEFGAELEQETVLPPYYLWRRGESEELDAQQMLKDLPNSTLVFGSDPPRLTPFTLPMDEFANRREAQLNDMLQRPRLVPLGTGRKREYPIVRCPLVIGRTGGAKDFRQFARLELNLDEYHNGNQVSREHCAIIYESDRFYLYRLHDETPTYLNGRQMYHSQAVPLSNGDIIQLAAASPAVRLQFLFSQG